MQDQALRAKRLGATALGAVAFFFLFAVQVPLFYRDFPRRPHTIDMLNYLTAAKVGLTSGWSHIYDPALQGPTYVGLSGVSRFEWKDYFVSPPPVAWLMTPFTLLPVAVAVWIWFAISLAALVFAAWRVSPWTGWGRAVALLLGLAMYPVLIALQFGQVTPVIAAAVALAWDALRRNRETAAGLLLVAVALKPQVGVFVPFALLLAGYRRTFVVWLAGAGLLGLVSLASLRITGVHQLLNDLAEEQRHLDNAVWTMAWLVGVGPLATLAEGLCVVAALAAGWLARGRRDATLPIIAGTLGSLLGAGYHHSIDFPAVLPLALIQLHSLRGWPAAIFVVAGVAACVVIPPVGPGPLLVFLSAWLGLSVAQARGPVGRLAYTRSMTTLPEASDR